MKTFLALALTSGILCAQTADEHRAAAKKAAGSDLMGLYNRVCTAAPAPAPRTGAKGAAPQPQIPPRDQRYMEPVKVFDN